MIKIQASVSKGWLHREANFIFDDKYYTDPFHRMQQDLKCDEFIKNRFPGYPLYNMEDNLVQAEFVLQNQMLVGAIQPNMIIAAALGAEFVFSPDKDSDVKGYPLNEIRELSELPKPESILEKKHLRDLDNSFDEAKAKYPQYRLIPAFFWDTSGRGTIHGIITTSFKLIGDNIFTKMMEEPDLVLGIHQWITDVYIVVLRHFSRKGNLPVSLVHVGECSGTMLSEEAYLKYVTPFISRLGKTFGGIRLHSCGNAEHIMEAILRVENLKSIDLGSGTSISLPRKKMGKNFEISVFPPVNALTKGSDISIIKNWLYKIIEENDGGNLKIEYHLEAEYEEKNCFFINEELQRLRLYENHRLY